LSLTTANKLDN